MTSQRSKHTRYVIIYLLCLLSWADFAAAQQAMVRSYDAPALSIGQAFLMHYGERCIAVLPEHVATEAGIPSFLHEGKSVILGEAESVDNLGDDIAVASLTGHITKRCGYSITSIGRAIDHILQGQALGTLRSVNSDGTIANMAVTIVDNDGTAFLRVQPDNIRNQIRKGQSGSLLMVDNRPVGMLLAVNSRHGVGKIIRLDTLLKRVEAHMAKISRRPAPPPSAAAGKAISDFASASQGAHITGWSTTPIDNKHLTANLIADEGAPAWRSRVDHWPVEIEIDLAGDDKVIINSMSLDGSSVSKTELPGRIEISVNMSADTVRWRSLLTRKVEFNEQEGIARFKFAPNWARQLKIAIWGAQGGGDTVSLRRIRVYGP